MPNSILFVCTGNTCRSPAAAALFGSRLADPQGWWLESAGTRASRGAPASGQVLALLVAGRGLDLTHHHAKPLEDLPVEQFDLILVMEREHQHDVQARYPALARRIRLISEMSGGASEIADPFGRGPTAYANMLEELERLLELGMAGILDYVGGRSTA
jgi:protein-tyrosine-phosphatase